MKLWNSKRVPCLIQRQTHVSSVYCRLKTFPVSWINNVRWVSQIMKKVKFDLFWHWHRHDSCMQVDVLNLCWVQTCLRYPKLIHIHIRDTYMYTHTHIYVYTYTYIYIYLYFNLHHIPISRGIFLYDFYATMWYVYWLRRFVYVLPAVCVVYLLSIWILWWVHAAK